MMNVFQILQQLRNNPTQVLQQRGLNIPMDIANNPNAIIQYLLNSGRITQQQVNQAMQMANQFRK